VVILDLAKHRFEEARELYADEWLGFAEADLESMMVKAGFADIDVAIVDKDAEAPQFQTLLATAERVATDAILTPPTSINMGTSA
jgi:ArsR family transcriptional regulator